MKLATPCKTTKQVRRPRCKQCGKQFRTNSTTAIYCTRQCKQLAAAIKKRVSYTARASNSAFMYQLAAACEQAGTLQVLQGHTVASLTDLHALYKRRLCVNEYGSTSAYALSHIHPVRGHDSIGTFHAANLVLAPSVWNRLHGTKHFGHGLSIPRSQLQSRHDVHKGSSRKETITRIIRYLGEDVISEFAKAVKLQPTQRHRTLAWLYDHLDPTIPEHAEHLDGLDAMSSKALSTLKAKLQGKEAGGFKLIGREASLFGILAEELARFAAIRPDLAPLAGFIQECSVRINHRESVITESELLPLLFDLLHGKALSAVAGELSPALHQLKALGKITLPVPVLGVPSQLQAETAAKPAVVVLKTFRSFADELDEQMDDMPLPVLQAHTVAYETAPLPWDR